MSRIPCLDGLRAISILLVIVGHAYQGIYHFDPVEPWWTILGNGNLGVEIFFVISGFLITSLLLREKEKYGDISLRNFYIRRLFRIFPPFYFYIGVIILVAMVTSLELQSGDVFSAMAFVWNYSPVAHSWTLAHTWSLSVEEQFYLFWPATMVFILVKGNRQTAAGFALALIISAPVLRVLTHLTHHPFMAERINFMLHTRVDALMFGCLTALLSGTPLLESVYRKVERSIWIFPIFIFGVSPFLTRHWGGAYLYIVGFTLEGAMIALTMLWLIRNSESVAGRILNSRPIVHVGIISYSLYLWQQLLLNGKNESFFGKFPYNLAFMLLAAEFSYYVIERKFLGWRWRFEFQRKLKSGAGQDVVKVS